MSYAVMGDPNQVLKRVGQSRLGSISHPRGVSIGPDQHGGGSRDCAERRKLPRTNVFGVDQLDAIRPCSDVEAAGLTEVEQYRSTIVQQAEDSRGSVGGDQVEILVRWNTNMRRTV